MERILQRAGLCLAGPSCSSFLVPGPGDVGTGQAQMTTLVASFSHLYNGFLRIH